MVKIHENWNHFYKVYFLKFVNSLIEGIKALI